MKFLELKIPPLFLTLIIIILMRLVSLHFTYTTFSYSWSKITACLVLFAGVSIVFLGVREFRKAQTTMNPREPGEASQLVISGVYKITRNPMYLGFLLLLIAWALYLSQVVVFVFIPAFVIYMNRFQIIPEEQFMKQKFGEQFSAYMSSVRRWI